MLIVTELSEAVEADRDGDENLFWKEIADVFIRLLDLCGSEDIHIETFINNKMVKNANRPVKHGRKY